MSKGSGRRVSQVSIAQLDANWEAVFGKKDQSTEIECGVVPDMSNIEKVKAFMRLEGMGDTMVEGGTIDAVCEYLKELDDISNTHGRSN